jgi:hypothetical protein
MIKIINHVKSNDKNFLYFEIKLLILNIKSSSTFNFRIYSLKNKNGIEIRDPNINNSDYIYNIKKFDLKKEIIIKFKLDINYLINNEITNIKIALCEEGIAWHLNDAISSDIDLRSLEKSRKEYFNRNIIHDIALDTIFWPSDGYGSSAQQLAIHLSKYKEIFLNPRYEHPEARNDCDKKLLKLVKTNELAKNYIFYHVPEDTGTNCYNYHKKNKSKLFSYTMFETTKIPSTWKRRIESSFEYLIVPSEFCKNIFLDGGIKIPIFGCRDLSACATSIPVGPGPRSKSNMAISGAYRA